MEYSPPFYAASMRGFGVDIDAPRPPFVLWKLAWRAGLRHVLGLPWMALTVVVRLVAGVLGVGAGIFGHGDEGGGTGDVRWKDYDSAPLWPDGRSTEDALGMERDEYL